MFFANAIRMCFWGWSQHEGMPWYLPWLITQTDRIGMDPFCTRFEGVISAEWSECEFGWTATQNRWTCAKRNNDLDNGIHPPIHVCTYLYLYLVHTSGSVPPSIHPSISLSLYRSVSSPFCLFAFPLARLLFVCLCLYVYLISRCLLLNYRALQSNIVDI
jgi:hypothetical protein